MSNGALIEIVSDTKNTGQQGFMLVKGSASADILVCQEGLSFWGGVDPKNGQIIDRHHPNHTASIAGKIVLMPTSRGSCSGSGVLLELALNGHAPAALIFASPEDILSLGALVAERLFGKSIPIIHLDEASYSALAKEPSATIRTGAIISPALHISLKAISTDAMTLSDEDQAFLDGTHGIAAQMAMEILCLMAISQHATALISVTRGHIDGCILAHDANLIFAEKMQEIGAKITIPTTINAISVDRENWQLQQVPPDFGTKASRLADAYVAMGARAVFTCAPYLLSDKPQLGEAIGWSESNAVIFANSILGARTSKHPDYLDLFIAMTGRAPASGVYHDKYRRAQIILEITPPTNQPDSSFWPIIGWVCGRHAPHQIPLITGLEALAPSQDDLKNLCAAFGTTSGAPMLHIKGHTPEADLPVTTRAQIVPVTQAAIDDAYAALSPPLKHVDLIAIGSPHASFDEVKYVHDALGDRSCHEGVTVIITTSRDTVAALHEAGIYAPLKQAGVQIISDICWCSITAPIYPKTARYVMTNSGKYAHYSYGLSGRKACLASLQACVETALSGTA